MSSFFQEQFKKEKVAAKKVWRGYLKILIVFWGIIGVICLFTPAFFLGLGFCGASVYVWYRIKDKKDKPQSV